MCCYKKDIIAQNLINIASYNFPNKIILKWFNIMKKMLFKLRFLKCQIIWNYNGITTLLSTFVLKMVNN
jgi:hypothetical protein